ncbi:putative phage baseplate protein [Escherichia coli]|nr:putative phage baseplate protein [Escherichia coli]
MADSEFQRPTLAENISMLRNDLFARLDVSDTLRRMDEDVRAKVYAAALHTVYGYIDYLAMNMLPDLCDESWLGATCCDETVSAQGGHGCQRVYALGRCQRWPEGDCRECYSAR